MGKLRKPLNKKSGIIATGKFSMETAKMYMAAALLTFHIVPLFFVFMGENGKAILLQMFLYMLNPILLFAIGFFYGVRNGFDFKFPLLFTVISTASVAMYYDFGDANHFALALMLSLCVYLIFAFVSTVVGGFVKKFLV